METKHDFRFYLYLCALEKQSHEKSLSPLNTILDITFLDLLVFRKVFLTFAFVIVLSMPTVA